MLIFFSPTHTKNVFWSCSCEILWEAGHECCREKEQKGCHKMLPGQQDSFLSDEHSSCAQCILFKSTGQSSLGKLSNIPSVIAKDPQCFEWEPASRPRKNPRGLAFFRQCFLNEFLWTPPYREECGLSKVRGMEVGTEGKPIMIQTEPCSPQD